VSVHREEHLDLCAAWVLGSIDEADRLELEHHRAQGCEVCERALLELGEGALALAAGAPAAEPRPALREAVLARVRAEGAAPRAAGRARGRGAPVSVAAPERAGRPARVSPAWPAWALAAAAAILAVSAVASWRAVFRLEGELQGARERVARAERDLAEERAWSALAASPGARVIELAPTQAGLALPRVRATYDPASRRAIIAFEGLVTPAGSDFELWAIHPSGAVSLGVVHADAGGRAEVRVPDAGEAAALSAFALSLEHAGGSPDPHKPAGPVVLAGAIKS
jgi:hypothetical protein